MPPPVWASLLCGGCASSAPPRPSSVRVTSWAAALSRHGLAVEPASAKAGLDDLPQTFVGRDAEPRSASEQARLKLADDQKASVWRLHDITGWLGHAAQRSRGRYARAMTAAEVAACLRSTDAAKQRAVRAHLDALQADLDAGKGIRTTPRELMAGIRAELGFEPR